MNNKGFTFKFRFFLQSHIYLVVIGLLLIFLVSACDAATQTLPAESSLSEVQTAVAATVGADESATSVPTATRTPTPTPTPYATFSTVAVTPTSVSSWTYSTYTDCYDSEYVKDLNIPDGTIMSPGETFVKTWKFENTGSCAWDSNFLVVFVSGDIMSGSDAETDTIVSVNKRTDVSVSLTAPDEVGTYAGYWSLADEYGNTFGEWSYVEIVVAEDATSTPTPTPTATSTSTPTPTPTMVNTSTTTDTPVSTSTTTPTPTPTGISTDTPTPTSTPTYIPDFTSTPTPTDILTDTDTPVPTSTPTDTPIPTSTTEEEPTE